MTIPNITPEITSEAIFNAVAYAQSIHRGGGGSSGSLSRLAELTSHPGIINQHASYSRAAQLWAVGVPGEIEPYETRDDSEVEFIQGLCQSSGCGKLRDGVCKPSCGAGMIVEVKARMASEGCPWTCRRW